MVSNVLWQPQRRFVRKDISPEELAERRRQQALLLCSFAKNCPSWLLADRLAKAWELGGCQAMGIQPPQ